MERHILTLMRIRNRLRIDPAKLSGYSRGQLSVLVQLYLVGRARLKDVARIEMLSTPNLCAMLKKLERDGLVVHSIDDHDRRNTWYNLTPAGANVAMRAIAGVRDAMEQMFARLTAQSRQDLIVAMQTVNNILNKVVNTDA